MNRADLLAIAPFMALGAVIVLVMLLIAVKRDHRLIAGATAIGLLLTLGALALAAPYAPRLATPLLIIDGYALYFIGLIVLSALAVSLLSYGYLAVMTRVAREEFYLLLLLATLGSAVMAASHHFASFFIGLETLSISLLGLIGYPRTLERPLEAAIKYLVLSGVSSAFLLFGVALVYATLGDLSFAALAPRAAEGAPQSLWWTAGAAMILVGIGFKLSLVPFHLWAPDVYEGAPAPVTAYVAVVSKCAVFALLLRYLLTAGGFDSDALLAALIALSVLSMLAGNLLALLQNNVKRLLAYSSIAHVGYALVALLAGGALAIEAVSLYLAAYAVMTLGAFGTLTLISDSRLDRDADGLEDFRGLFWRHPWLAVVFAVMLLSLAGIPLTAGFIAKFYAIASGVQAHLTTAVTALVIGSIVGLYYYLRVIVVMLMPERQPSAPFPRAAAPWLGHTVIAALLILLIGIGAYPGPLIGLIRQTALALAAPGL